MLFRDDKCGRKVTDAAFHAELNCHDVVKTIPPKVGLKIREAVTSLYETLDVSPRASHFVIRAACQSLVQHH